MRNVLFFVLIITAFISCRTVDKNANDQSATSSSVKPVEHENDDLDILANANELFITLKNSAQAQIFYDAMEVSETEYQGNVIAKDLKTSQKPGEQVLELLCEKIGKDIITYKCILNIEKPTSSKKAYKIHASKKDKNILVFRNDTDYSDAAKAIYDIFTKQTISDVIAGKDQHAGVTVIGGKGFALPSADSILQLQCRKDGQKYFCEFLLKNPWPKDYDVIPPTPKCIPNGQECNSIDECEQKCCTDGHKILLDPYGDFSGRECCDLDESDCQYSNHGGTGTGTGTGGGHAQCLPDGASCGRGLGECCNENCNGRICTGPGTNPLPGGFRCDRDAQCNEGICVEGRCVRSGSGVNGCLSDAGCNGGYCISGRCVQAGSGPNGCTSDAGCNGGACIQGHCVRN